MASSNSAMPRYSVPFPYLQGIDVATARQLEENFRYVLSLIGNVTNFFDAVIDPTATADIASHVYPNLTTLLAAPTGTTLLFANTGREQLYVSAGAVSETVTVDVGALVDGQTVANFTTVNLTNGDIYRFGEFHSVIETPGTNTVTATLSTVTGTTVALQQSVGVY